MVGSIKLFGCRCFEHFESLHEQVVSLIIATLLLSTSEFKVTRLIAGGPAAIDLVLHKNESRYREPLMLGYEAAIPFFLYFPKFLYLNLIKKTLNYIYFSAHCN